MTSKKIYYQKNKEKWKIMELLKEQLYETTNTFQEKR